MICALADHDEPRRTRTLPRLWTWWIVRGIKHFTKTIASPKKGRSFLHILKLGPSTHPRLVKVCHGWPVKDHRGSRRPTKANEALHFQRNINHPLKYLRLRFIKLLVFEFQKKYQWIIKVYLLTTNYLQIISNLYGLGGIHCCSPRHGTKV